MSLVRFVTRTIHGPVCRLVVAICLGAPAVAAAATAQVDSVRPPYGQLPYVDEVLIGPAVGQGRICGGDSIAVRFRGTFPTPCFELVRVEVIPPPYASPEPHPPTIRLVVRDSCIVCPDVLTGWGGGAVFPPLPPNLYKLPMEMLIYSCPDSIHPDRPDSVLYFTEAPFTVERCDSISPMVCVTGDWVPGPDSSRCNAVVGPQQPAQIYFEVSSDVALAGLQGEFFVYPGNLVITDIHATGPAVGMHVSWTQTEYGARFNMFAELGAPIPGDSVPPPNRHPPVPILALTLVPRTASIDPVTYVTAGGLLGSDEFGHAVPECNILTFVAVEAQICAEPGCDFNADGIADVRDLVLMAHCTFSRSDTTRSLCAENMPDCNSDGRKSLEDVICCAIHILRGPLCPGCPIDSTRPAPNVHVLLSDPTFTESGAEVGIRVDELGAPTVGGAVLRLEYPADRYTAELVLPPSDDAWLTLSDVSQGQATIGMVRLTNEVTLTNSASGSAAIPAMKLRLKLRPGSTHGGAVSLSGAEFSGPDGVKLTTPASHPEVPLGGTPRLALSDAHPNPFSGGTQFSLTLDRPANVSVGIFDLAGRRVAMLHQGLLPAGNREFAWNGMRDGGAAARGGVYFYRAVAGTVVVARKMVLLGN